MLTPDERTKIHATVISIHEAAVPSWCPEMLFCESKSSKSTLQCKFLLSIVQIKTKYIFLRCCFEKSDM